MLAVACATAVSAGAMAATAAAEDGPRARFAPDSYVEKPLAPNEAIDPLSDVMVRALKAEFDVQFNDPAPQRKPAVDNFWCSPHVYTVGPTQLKVDVILPPHAPQALKDQIGKVPIPPHAIETPECSDKPLTIWQPSTDSTWDLIGAVKDSQGRWHAGYGGLITPANNMHGVSQNPGHWENQPFGFGAGYGATATSIPRLAGLQRIDELLAGEIDHAVAFQMRAPAPCYRWPAQRQDGRTTLSHPRDVVEGRARAEDPPNNNPLAPPEGARLRLPASLDIDALGLPPYTRTLAKAVQRYGMVLADRSSQVGFTVEKSPRFTGVPGHENDPDPYAQIFGGWAPWDLLNRFPWDKLQVLAVPPQAHLCEPPVEKQILGG